MEHRVLKQFKRWWRHHLEDWNVNQDQSNLEPFDWLELAFSRLRAESQRLGGVRQLIKAVQSAMDVVKTSTSVWIRRVVVGNIMQHLPVNNLRFNTPGRGNQKKKKYFYPWICPGDGCFWGQVWKWVSILALCLFSHATSLQADRCGVLQPGEGGRGWVGRSHTLDQPQLFVLLIHLCVRTLLPRRRRMTTSCYYLSVIGWVKQPISSYHVSSLEGVVKPSCPDAFSSLLPCN